ncbi:hypothetical protein OCUBac02_33140 [Bosea sp. ANAM02]|nr:hypothetical protein OCUBac02_33140 [Bosea sp. ANAM02]
MGKDFLTFDFRGLLPSGRESLGEANMPLQRFRKGVAQLDPRPRMQSELDREPPCSIDESEAPRNTRFGASAIFAEPEDQLLQKQVANTAR